jgi:hypothetical protein
MLLGVARCSRIRLFKGVYCLAVAERCGVLRRRWRQRGVRWRLQHALIISFVWLRELPPPNILLHYGRSTPTREPPVLSFWAIVPR